MQTYDRHLTAAAYVVDVGVGVGSLGMHTSLVLRQLSYHVGRILLLAVSRGPMAGFRLPVFFPRDTNLSVRVSIISPTAHQVSYCCRDGWLSLDV
jgi:hypothetical protein